MSEKGSKILFPLLSLNGLPLVQKLSLEKMFKIMNYNEVKEMSFYFQLQREGEGGRRGCGQSWRNYTYQCLLPHI